MHTLFIATRWRASLALLLLSSACNGTRTGLDDGQTKSPLDASTPAEDPGKTNPALAAQPTDEGAEPCDPHSTRECRCTNSTSAGTKTCLSDGSGFGHCRCGDESAVAAVDAATEVEAPSTSESASDASALPGSDASLDASVDASPARLPGAPLVQCPDVFDEAIESRSCSGEFSCTMKGKCCCGDFLCDELRVACNGHSIEVLEQTTFCQFDCPPPDSCTSETLREGVPTADNQLLPVRAAPEQPTCADEAVLAQQVYSWKANTVGSVYIRATAEDNDPILQVKRASCFKTPTLALCNDAAAGAEDGSAGLLLKVGMGELLIVYVSLKGEGNTPVNLSIEAATQQSCDTAFVDCGNGCVNPVSDTACGCNAIECLPENGQKTVCVPNDSAPFASCELSDPAQCVDGYADCEQQNVCLDVVDDEHCGCADETCINNDTVSSSCQATDEFPWAACTEPTCSEGYAQCGEDQCAALLDDEACGCAEEECEPGLGQDTQCTLLPTGDDAHCDPVLPCHSGYADCDGDGVCEAVGTTDSCGCNAEVCVSSERCVVNADDVGACAEACGAGSADCNDDGTCEAIGQATSCGCGKLNCGPNAQCTLDGEKGKCECDPGFVDCSGTCTDLESSATCGCNALECGATEACKIAADGKTGSCEAGSGCAGGAIRCAGSNECSQRNNAVCGCRLEACQGWLGYVCRADDSSPGDYTCVAN